MACYTGQEAVANELVNRGANVNQPNHRGCTPLHLAAVSTNGALCLELLVNNGADVNMQVSRIKCSSSVQFRLFACLSVSQKEDFEAFLVVRTITFYYSSPNIWKD